ncbi:MAG: DNA cytosine methyltransferase, partial [Candidatus Fonsibacter sp.]
MLSKTVTYKKSTAIYLDVRDRSTKDVPRCDVFITGLACVACSSLGKRKGASSSQGRLLFHSLQVIVQKLPQVVVIENVRGLIFK